MIIDMGYWSRVFKKILIAIFTIICLYIAFKLSVFYMPFLIAFIISLMIEPLIRRVNRKTKLNRKTSAITVLAIVSLVIIGLLTFGIISLIDEASNFLQGINGYYDKINSQIQSWMQSINSSIIQLPQDVRNIIENSSVEFIQFVSNWLKGILTSFLQSITSVPTVAIYIGVTLLSIYFICADKLYILDQIEHHLPKTWVRRLGKHVRELISTLGGYLKAEATLIIISFIQVLIGLHIMKFMGLNVEYPLLAAIGIGFVDALPILGSGSVIVPWAIIAAFNGDITLAIALLILLLIISVVRQLLEPKLISKHIGIHPIFTLIAMYTGLRFMGIIGLLIGPIILIVLKNVFGTLIEQGVFKTIFDRS